MVLQCSIYDFNFRTLTEEPELCAARNLKTKDHLFPSNHPYNVKRDQNNDHAYCDVFRSKEMKDMASGSGRMTTPGPHTYVIRFALRFYLWYYAHASEKECAG